jgi:hypothetical protein
LGFAGLSVVILVLAVPVALAWWFQNWLALALIVPLGFLARPVMRPLAIYPQHETVRDAVLYLTSARDHEGSGTNLSDNEIAEKVRLIIMENLGVPRDQLHEGARFVEDLGAQ